MLSCESQQCTYIFEIGLVISILHISNLLAELADYVEIYLLCFLPISALICGSISTLWRFLRWGHSIKPFSCEFGVHTPPIFFQLLKSIFKFNLSEYKRISVKFEENIYKLAFSVLLKLSKVYKSLELKFLLSKSERLFIF